MNDSIQIEELTSELQMVYQYLRKLGISHQDAEKEPKKLPIVFLFIMIRSKSLK